MIRRCLLFLATLVSAVSLAAPEKHPNFSQDLSTEVSEVWALEETSSLEVFAEVAKMIGRPASFVRNIELFSATVVSRRTRKPVEAWLAVVPLGGPAVGARVTIAMDVQGEIIAAGLRGSADFDTDSKGRWMIFMSIFLRGSGAKERDRETGYREVAARLEKISTEPEVDAQLVQALVHSRRSNRRNSLVIGNANMLLQRSEVIESSWFDSIIEDMRELADNGLELGSGERSCSWIACEE